MDKNEFARNVKMFKDRLNAAAAKANVSPKDITTVAVTKYVDTDTIAMASNIGFHAFGESKVQNFLKKYEFFNGGFDWHFIGHLQANKVKYMVEKVKLIHSVHSWGLLKEIDKCAKNKAIISDVLLQVNVSCESTKHGFTTEEVRKVVCDVGPLSNVRVKGLMTMAPLTEDRPLIRQVFSDLRKIFVDIKKENVNNVDMRFLSMGMSNDFEIAIEEGANIIRVGSVLFGNNTTHNI